MEELTRDGDDQKRSDASAGCDSLGRPMRTFKPSALNRLVVAVCGATMVGCGLVVSFYPDAGRSMIFGPSLVGAGALVLLLAFVLLRNQSLLICSGGIQRIWGRNQERYCWDEVCEIVSTQVKTPLVTSRRCSLVGRNRTRIVLTDLAIGQYDEMIALLRQLAEAHSIPWKEEQVAR